MWYVRIITRVCTCSSHLDAKGFGALACGGIDPGHVLFLVRVEFLIRMRVGPRNELGILNAVCRGAVMHWCDALV